MASSEQIKRLGDCSPGQMKSVESMQTGTHGSGSSQFTSGASPIVDGGKMLIGNGVYQAKLRTSVPVGKRHGKPVGKRG